MTPHARPARPGSQAIKVIAFGSPLRGDDGVGSAVLHRLRACDLPPEVELIEGGTGALALLELLTDQGQGAPAPAPPPSSDQCRPTRLIIDAVDMGLEPGALRVLDLDTHITVMARAGAPPLSLHHADLAGALALARALGWQVRARVIAVQPADVAPRLGLAPAVASAVEEAAAAVLKEIEKAEP